MARRVVSVVAVLLAITGVLAAVRAHQDPSAGQRLAAARAFVRDHRSAQLTGTLRVGGTDKEFHGAIAGAKRTRVVVTSAEGVREELLVVGDAAYARYATSDAALGTALYRPLNAATVADYHVREVDPATVLAAANHPRVKGRSIEADVDTRLLLGRKPKSIRWMTVSFVLDDAGALTRVAVVSRTERGTDRTAARFADWGSRVRITPPRPDQLDRTPGIDEAGLAAWNDAPLYVPRRLPARFRLVRGGVIPKQETEEGCPQTELGYEDPTDPDSRFLYLYEFPRACAREPSSPDVMFFRAGNYTGFAQRFADGNTRAQITVRETTVQADSSLSLDDLSKTLADLVPFVLRQ